MVTVTLRTPVWPPSPANRVLLDVHDTGYRSGSGGEVVEFTAAFGGHVMPCPALATGPVAFSGCSHLRLSVP